MSGKRRNIDSDFEAKNHQLQFHGSLNRAAAKGRGRQMFRSPIPKIFSSVCARWTRISRGVTGSAPVSSMEGLKSPDHSNGALKRHQLLADAPPISGRHLAFGRPFLSGVVSVLRP